MKLLGPEKAQRDLGDATIAAQGMSITTIIMLENRGERISDPPQNKMSEVLEVKNLTAPSSLRAGVVFSGDTANPIVFELH